jgi:hypothetical protein
VVDVLAAAPAADDAPAPSAPARTAEQIREIVQRATDERVKGLQSTLGKQIQTLKDENAALRRQFGTEDDRTSDLEAERKRLQRERDTYKAAAKNPALAPLLEQLLESESPEDWATALVAWQTSQTTQTAPPTVPTPDSEPTPDVDPNRNRREPSGWGPDGPTGEQGLEFLKGVKVWPTLER